MEVHHFCRDGCELTSEKGSKQFCCSSFSEVYGITCGTEANPPDHVLPGTYQQIYSNGHTDKTTVACDGTMKWRGGEIEYHQLYPAGVPDGLPDLRAKQNNDPNYRAEDGWYFREWDREEAWEFVRFTGEGVMEVDHFCSDGLCTGSSSRGSKNFCCNSVSDVDPKFCSFQPVYARIATLEAAFNQSSQDATLSTQLDEAMGTMADLKGQVTKLKETASTLAALQSQVNGIADTLKGVTDRLKKAGIADGAALAESGQGAVRCSSSPSGCDPVIEATDQGQMTIKVPEGELAIQTASCGTVDLCDVVKTLDKATSALRNLAP